MIFANYKAKCAQPQTVSLHKSKEEGYKTVAGKDSNASPVVLIDMFAKIGFHLIKTMSNALLSRDNHIIAIPE